MLPADLSPIHRTVYPWWNSQRQPSICQVTELRENLLAAAIDESRASRESARSYDPFSDFRFKWAQQYLERAANQRRSIDSDITNLASLFFDPPTTSHQHLAANDNPDT